MTAVRQAPILPKPSSRESPWLKFVVDFIIVVGNVTLTEGTDAVRGGFRSSFHSIFDPSCHPVDRRWNTASVTTAFVPSPFCTGARPFDVLYRLLLPMLHFY